jgi:hypothetical protein
MNCSSMNYGATVRDLQSPDVQQDVIELLLCIMVNSDDANCPPNHIVQFIYL